MLIYLPYLLHLLRIVFGAILILFFIGLNSYSGSRGLTSNFSSIILLYCFLLSIFYRNPYKNVVKMFTAIIVILLFYISFQTTNVSAKSYQPDQTFIDAMSWFIKNQKNHSYLYLEPYYPYNVPIKTIYDTTDFYMLFESQTRIYNYFGKHYSSSFISSKIPYVLNDYINFKRLYFRNFYQFIGIADQQNVQYFLMTDDTYNSLKLNLSPFTKIIYRTSKQIILEYLFHRQL